MKKALSVIIAVITVFCCFSLFCAAEDTGEIKNFKVDEYGFITWDDYGGYDNYWLQVDIYSTPVDYASNIKSRIDEPGEYPLCLFLCDDDGNTVAKSEMFIKYDGDKFYTIEKPSETELPTETETEPEPEDTTDYGDGIIKNVTLSKDGILSWDEYELANQYWIGIDGEYIMINNGESVYRKSLVSGEHILELEAYSQTDKKIANWYGAMDYDGSEFRLKMNEGETVTETETEAEPETVADTAETAKTETETETDPQDGDNKNNGKKWIIIGVSVAVAFIGVIAVLFLRKKAEDNK